MESRNVPVPWAPAAVRARACDVVRAAAVPRVPSPRGVSSCVTSVRGCASSSTAAAAHSTSASLSASSTATRRICERTGHHRIDGYPPCAVVNKKPDVLRSILLFLSRYIMSKSLIVHNPCMDLTTCYLLLCTRILVSWFLSYAVANFFCLLNPTSSHVYFSAILDPICKKLWLASCLFCFGVVCDWPVNIYNCVRLRYI